MANGIARTGDDRILISAISELRQGSTPEEALARIQQRFGWISELTGINYVNRAIASLEAASGLQEQLAPFAVPLNQPEPRFPDPMREVVTEVTINVPGRDPFYRNIRTRVSPGMTDADIAREITDVINLWMLTYGSDNRTMDWKVSYILR